MNIKLKFLKPFLPPVLVQLATSVTRRASVRFSGEYDSWEAADNGSGGYDSAEIADRVLNATRRVVCGESAYERDSVLFDRVEYSWPVLASLLQVAAECRSLHVIDFGGSLGSSWRQNRSFLKRLQMPLSWRVVEQEHFVALGQAEFSDRVLSFHGNVADAAIGGVDVVLFSSSLCYVRDPWSVMQEVMATSARFLVVDRLPTIPGDQDRIRIQHVSEPIYRANYPIRLFGRHRVMSGLLAGWGVIETWQSELQPDRDSICQGYFMERL